MSNPNIPIRRTGSADNERVQLNKALSGVDETLERADQWDASFAWGDHRDAGYEVALTESQIFENLGVPSGLAATQLLDTDPAGSDRIALQISWNRIGDESISYDLEIRKSAVGVTTDPLANADLYSVPIIANDLSVSTIRYTDFFDPDQRYWFRVRIRRDRFVSPWSAFVNIATTQNLATPPTPTLAPLTPFLEGIKLDWSGYPFSANPNVAFIEVQRNGSTIERVARPTAQYLDEPLDPAITYSYRIRAVSYAGVESAFSVTRTASPQNQDDGNVVIRSATAPTTRPPEGSGPALRVGDRWLKSDEGDLPHSWDGQQWVREYTSIDGGNIITGTLDANRIIAGTITTDRMTANTINGDRIQTNTLNANRITAGSITTDRMTANTINADRLANGTLGSVKFAANLQSDNFQNNVAGWRIERNTGNVQFNNIVSRGAVVVVGGDNITDLTNNAGFTDFDATNVEAAIANNVTTIDGGKITTGTVQSANYQQGVAGWKIGISGNDAEFNDIVARGSLLAGPVDANIRRVEVTPATGTDYVIWVGSNAKTDENGIFWVKADGTVKIDKTAFNIGAVPVRRTREDSLVTGLTQNSNGLITTFDQFPSNGQDVLVEVNHSFSAFKATVNPQTCAVPQATTGTIALQRSFDNGATWSGNIATSTISYPSTANLLTDPDPSVPDVCQQRGTGQANRALLDDNPPSEGTLIRYRILFTAWSSFFISTSSPNEISTNRFDAALTQ